MLNTFYSSKQQMRENVASFVGQDTIKPRLGRTCLSTSNHVESVLAIDILLEVQVLKKVGHSSAVT